MGKKKKPKTNNLPLLCYRFMVDQIGLLCMFVSLSCTASCVRKSKMNSQVLRSGFKFWYCVRLGVSLTGSVSFCFLICKIGKTVVPKSEIVRYEISSVNGTLWMFSSWYYFFIMNHLTAINSVFIYLLFGLLAEYCTDGNAHLA